jgi:molecular chaperone HtpG
MAKKQFKAESKRLLDLMINSIYTHKEIFLRELISNGSDAIDKLYYKMLMEEGSSGINRDDFEIEIKTNKTDRTLKISDNGIGMTKEEMESNLGTIARSGSLDFREDAKEEEEDKKPQQQSGIDIIGQFGVGFYSAFMVSDQVTVISRAYGSDKAYKWESEGTAGYTIEEYDKKDVGTEITLHIKKNEKTKGSGNETSDAEDYDSYLEAYKIKQLVGRYSDYIRYPVKMKEGGEIKILNSMVPIWKQQKSKLKKEDYNDFYKQKFHDYVDPLKVIHSSVEGVTSYSALLFLPAHAPYNYYTKDYEKGLQLYSSGVMIMDKCADLLPDYFNFISGVVDSQDLSLNISREMLQHDRQLKAIGGRLEKKIKNELIAMQKYDRENYEKFFKAFGLQLKYGIYENFGMNKEALQDLVMFWSSTEKKPVTFAEYVARMPEEQKYIYYASGESADKIDRMPQTELLKDKGYEIFYLTEDVDEFVIQIMQSYQDKEFKSVSAEDFELEQTEEEKKAAEEKEKENKELLGFMKESLEGKVSEVKLSQRLKSHPVCITAKGGLSLEMEKVLNQMPMADGNGMKAERVLEINSDHKIMKALSKAFEAGDEKGKEKVREYTKLLYDQALLMEGMSIEDPFAFANSVCELMK